MESCSRCKLLEMKATILGSAKEESGFALVGRSDEFGNEVDAIQCFGIHAMDATRDLISKSFREL